MANTANSMDAMVRDLQEQLAKLVAAAHAAGRESALTELRAVLGGAAPAAKPGRKATAKAAPAKPAKAAKSGKGGKKRKNPWASLSPEARLARVNAIRKGRGLPVKDSL